MLTRREKNDADRKVQALFDRELCATTRHSGFEVLHKRYIDNGHKERLITAYGMIYPCLAHAQQALVVGASPLEGFLLSRLAPHLKVRMIGSPESFIYQSPDAFEFSRHVSGAERGECFSVERHNIEISAPFADGSFDVVICLEVIEHLRRDPLGAICDMRRLLRDGGLMYLSTPNLNSVNAIRRSLEWESPMFFPSFGPPPVGVIHAHEFSVREIELLVRRAGFTIDKFYSFNHAILPEFNHDERYRCGSADSSVKLEPPDDMTIASIQALRDHPLRGDYLFIEARGTGIPKPEPIHPLYCSF